MKNVLGQHEDKLSFFKSMTFELNLGTAYFLNLLSILLSDAQNIYTGTEKICQNLNNYI